MSYERHRDLGNVRPMGDLITPKFTNRLQRQGHHKGWPMETGAQSYLGADGQDGERRLADRALDLKAHAVGDAITTKMLRREEVRRSLRVIESDIDRDR